MGVVKPQTPDGMGRTGTVTISGVHGDLRTPNRTVVMTVMGTVYVTSSRVPVWVDGTGW